MASNWSGVAPGGQHPVRHGLGFAFSGGLAFLIDAAVLSVLAALGMHPIVARLFAIAIAMVAGWLAHRRFTFRLSSPPRVPEFLRYAAVGWTVAAINYGVFVLILLLRPATPPLHALIVSSLVAMVLSYVGMRFAAFRRLGSPHE
jgi:putative flippase GtrA